MSATLFVEYVLRGADDTYRFKSDGVGALYIESGDGQDIIVPSDEVKAFVERLRDFVTVGMEGHPA